MRPRPTRLLLEHLENRSVPATFTVMNANDSGAGSLRQAIADANAASGPDKIVFDPALAGAIIKLASPLQLADHVTITGPGTNANAMTVDGQGTVRPFNVSASVVAALSDLTIVRGSSGPGQSGGGILNSGTLTLTDVVVTRCQANLNGGGIANNGTLTLERTELVNNSAGDDGGGLVNAGPLTVNWSRIIANTSGNSGGGLLMGPAVGAVTATTIAGNIAGNAGGGVLVAGSSDATIKNCTISGNRASTGGGIHLLGQTLARVVNCTVVHNSSSAGGGGGIRNPTGTLSVVNSTIVGNSDTSNLASAAGGVMNDAGILVLANSIVSLNNAGPASVNANIDPTHITTNNDNFLGGDPRLGPLRDNGGATMTMAPLSGSPVIDAGTNAFVTKTGLIGGPPFTDDQRGFRRLIDGNLSSPVLVDQGAVEFNPGPEQPIVVGAGPGGEPRVKVYDQSGALRFNFLAFGAGFAGGVRVATGDVNGDWIEDIVVAAGPGGGPHVKVFDGATGAQIASFFAYAPGFTAGVYVAAADVDGDGHADIVTGAGAGAGPHVKVFSGSNPATELQSFMAFAPGFTGGVQVAAGLVNADAFADIVVGAGAGGGPHVQVFSGKDLTVLQSFFAFAANFTGGVFVACGDINGDFRDDIIVGQGAGGAPQVKVFSGASAPGTVLHDFIAYASNFAGGVRVATVDRDGDGRHDIITGAGAGGGPHVRSFSGSSLSHLDNFFAFDPSFLGGVYVG